MRPARGGEAVAGTHLVPVALIVDRGEDQDVEDQEAGADGDGHTQGRAVGAEAALRQGEVTLILREARGGRDKHRWLSAARGAARQVPHHDTIRFGLNLNILIFSRGNKKGENETGASRGVKKVYSLL